MGTLHSAHFVGDLDHLHRVIIKGGGGGGLSCGHDKTQTTDHAGCADPAD